MALEEIKKRILEKGDEEIRKIDAEARKEENNIENSIKADEEKVYKDVVDKRRQELELIPKRIISNARMEKKFRVESKKAEIVHNVFREAKKKILEMDDKEKGRILKNLAEDAKENVRDPVVYVDRRYSNLINAKARNIGDFGVIVESKDGLMRVDNTLNSVILRMGPDLKASVMRVLFEDAKEKISKPTP